ncbi:MAG: DUF503 domain-containing protein [Firmicutes bacterium]|jgi:uncharacterized protein YlxP (DUF503 family)|nr:DUF503 domain-containing protein [Bacillota bacterium]
MIVGTLVADVFIPGATSLKDKRRVVKSIVKRIQNRFNVSIVELENENLWQKAIIGIAIIGEEKEKIERQLQFVVNFMDADPRWEVIRVEMEWR